MYCKALGRLFELHKVFVEPSQTTMAAKVHLTGQGLLTVLVTNKEIAAQLSTRPLEFSCL